MCKQSPPFTFEFLSWNRVKAEFVAQSPSLFKNQSWNERVPIVRGVTLFLASLSLTFFHTRKI